MEGGYRLCLFLRWYIHFFPLFCGAEGRILGLCTLGKHWATSPAHFVVIRSVSSVYAWWCAACIEADTTNPSRLLACGNTCVKESACHAFLWGRLIEIRTMTPPSHTAESCSQAGALSGALTKVFWLLAESVVTHDVEVQRVRRTVPSQVGRKRVSFPDLFPSWTLFFLFWRCLRLALDYNKNKTCRARRRSFSHEHWNESRFSSRSKSLNLSRCQ